MTKQEFSQAFQIAKSNEKIDPGQEPIDLFDGFGFKDFAPVYVTLKQVARLIRWQAICMDGSIDSENLQEIANIGRKKFFII
jgi:hypothetical protein